MKNKKVCLFHSSDLDGHCSAMLVRHYVGPEVELYPINYNEEIDVNYFNKGDTLYIVDFCFNPDVMLELKNILGESLIWIDHHRSSIENARKFSFSSIDGLRSVSFSGCELTLTFFKDGPMYYPVKLLGRHDVWDHSDKNTFPFQYGMRNRDTFPTEKNYENLWKPLFVKGDDSEFFNTILNEGKLLFKYEQEQNKRYSRAYSYLATLEANGKEYSCIAINKGMANSSIFDGHPNKDKVDLFVVYCYTGTVMRYSIYSDKEHIDCSEIAKYFEGGGHKGASGFQSNILVLRSVHKGDR